MIQALKAKSRLIKQGVAAAVLGASLLFFGYSLYKNWQELQSYDWHFNVFYLLGAVVALLGAFMSNVGGWAVIIRRLGVSTSLRKNVEIYCLAAHAKRLPGIVWYVAGRAYLYQNAGVPVAVVVQGSLWEMALLVLSGLTIYGVFRPFYWASQHAYFNYLLLATIPISLVVAFPSVFQRLLPWLWRDWRAEHLVQVSPRNKALWISIYLLGWIAGGSILYFLMGAVSPVSLPLLPVCWGFVALSGVISVFAFFLPGGVGIREISLALLLSDYIPWSV
ncbi:MAG: flippase-like domain-containing protein, partial [Thermoflexales bacterium]|nr:flippase-like domain-containing protein [Thermoflexales bacterium]